MDDKKYIAILESKLDQAETEIKTLNMMLMTVGFERGIETLKMTIDEVLEAEREYIPDRSNDE